jgi:hypothetical protein
LDTNHGFFTLVNCVVSYNTSNQGGGVHVGSAFLTSLVNCTFVGNSGYGLFVDNNAGDVSMSNGILWGNTPGPVGGPGTQPTIAYSDVEGGWPGPGINNIDTDPQLVADVTGTWTSDPVYDAASDRTVLTDSNASFDVDGLVGQAMIPDTSLGSLQTVVLTNTATTITLIGEVWSAVVIAGEDYAIRSDRITPDSPCIDAGRNNAVPFGVTTDFDGKPRFLDVPETPDTGDGDPPLVDMGAHESLGAGCLAITDQEVICHGDGSTFTVNIEGLSPCTGDSVMATFTGAGGAVGEDFCTTLLINTDEGGFCCSTQLCVPVPDCSGAAIFCGLDGDGEVGVLDVLAMLSIWGPCPDCGDCVADLDGDCTVGITDFLILLANWGPCL